ncbi:MAG: hypothetical protein IJD35_04230 [Clostridia bacterium]|nr:hypothetical protein [Clostridia bacterium]
MAEEKTTQTLPIEEINQLTKTLVDTIANGTPKEIAKGLESQFVDRSTEHLYRKVTPTDQSGSTEVYKYVKGEIEGAFIPTRRDMKLSFPPTCYSSNDPISLLYESNYKLIQFWTLAILENEYIMGAFLEAMAQAGVDGSNIDDFLNTECAVLAHLQQMPLIASIQRKMPDYDDFNRFKPNNFRYLDAQKKIEHTMNGELVTKVSLETGGPADKGGNSTPLEIAEITTEVCIQQSMKALSEKEQSILRFRLQGKNMSEIATILGYHDASGVKKAIKRIGQKLIDAGVVDPDQLTGRKIS